MALPVKAFSSWENWEELGDPKDLILFAQHL